MGKIRRQRQKFHITSSNLREVRTSVEIDSNWNSSTRSDTVAELTPQALDNIFAGIEIPLNSITTKEDDVRTVISSSKKVFKDRCRTKEERRKLRHQTFIEKINAIQSMNKVKQTRKHITETPILESKPSTSKDLTTQEPERKIVKGGAILKSGARHRQMLRNISAMHKMWENPSFKADPIGVVSELVQEKVSKELS